MNILQKIQQQPLVIKKTIFWSIIIFVGLALLIGWYQIAQQRIKKFEGGEIIKLPSLEGVSKEELEKSLEGLEQNLQELEEATTTQE